MRQQDFAPVVIRYQESIDQFLDYVRGTYGGDTYTKADHQSPNWVAIL
jgi:hypothetical protein